MVLYKCDPVVQCCFHDVYDHFYGSDMKVYLRAHVEQFKYGVFDSLQWKQFFLEHFKEEVSGHDIYSKNSVQKYIISDLLAQYKFCGRSSRSTE